MKTEIWRVQDPENQGNSFVGRLNNGAIETIKEIRSTTGEVPDPANDLITTEIITLTRVKGETTQF